MVPGPRGFPGLGLRVIDEAGSIPFLQLPRDSLEGPGHFLLFLSHQVVLHPEPQSWD